MKANFVNLDYDDDRNRIVDKTNLNFDQLLFHGIGYPGDMGPVGIKGPTGPIGPRGRDGLNGQESSNWYKQSNPPTGDNIKKYDYWINTSPGSTGSNFIYFYDGDSWIFTNETLSKNSIFSNFQNIIGAGGIQEKNAIIPSNFINPWKETVVFSSSSLESSNINPNYSKLRIVSEGDSTLPLLTFSKLDFQDSQPPSIYWKGIDSEDMGLNYKSSDSFRLEAGRDIKILAGSRNSSATDNGDIELNTENRFSLNSTGDVYFKSGDDIATISSNGNFSSDSRNFTINNTQSRFERGLEISSEDSVVFGRGGIDQQRLPRISAISSIPPSAVMDTRAYSLTGLDNTTEFIVLEDFRLKEQNLGEGPFRTELVRVNPDNLSINIPYIKTGFPGATGSYPTKGVTEVDTSYSTVTNSGTQYSVVDLTDTSYYSKRGISVETNNSASPIGSADAVWVRVKTSDELNLNGVWSGDVLVPYRFYYRRNRGFGVTNSFKFGGIIFRKPQANSDTIISFDSPVQTFELVYYGEGKKAFYNTIYSSGFLDMSEFSSTQFSPREAFDNDSSVDAFTP